MKQSKTCKDVALTLLAFSSRTEYQLRKKLLEKGYSGDEVTMTMGFLHEYGFINDAEYVKTYCRVHGSKKSVARLKQDLERKGIEKSTIDEELDAIEIDELEQILKELKKKKIEPGQWLERKEYEKLASSLFRKGYSLDKIHQVLRNDG